MEGAKAALTVRELPPSVIKETETAEQQKYRRVRFCKELVGWPLKKLNIFIIIIIFFTEFIRAGSNVVVEIFVLCCRNEVCHIVLK